MKILFVAKAHSSHTANWLNQLQKTGWEIHLFPLDQPDEIHPDLRQVTIHTFTGYPRLGTDPTVTISPSIIFPFAARFFSRASLPISLNPLFRWYRARILKKIMLQIRPDIVHSMNMQDEGYAVGKIKTDLGSAFPAQWICTTWGSDIYFFGQHRKHQEKIRQTLSNCQLLITDCYRDQPLAKNFGFTGKFLGVFPGPGGYDVESMQKYRASGPTHQRRLILIKGYQGWAGRALNALQAIDQASELLHGYTLVVYSVYTNNIRQWVQQLKNNKHLAISILPPSSPQTMWSLFGQAKIAIGINISDGIPNAMLEAMIMGAFPIQSDTGATSEYLTSGTNGLLVEPTDSQSIYQAITQAVQDDALVDQAAKINRQLTKEKIDYSVIQPKVIQLYTDVF